MPAFTSISSIALIALLSSPAAWAVGFDDLTEVPAEKSESDSVEEFTETPYTQYGAFNEDEDEANAALFFQHGRFFGVSLGFGFHGVTGNRALLWQGGLPMVDLRVHYWFDFNFALQLQFFTTSHNYTIGAQPTEVNMNHFGGWLKYYFETKNLSAPITFANPYLMLGGGVFTKNEAEQSNPDDPDEDSVFGFGLGGGLEFMVTHRKVYFDLQGQFRMINFQDRLSTEFQSAGIQDLTGFFYSVTGSMLFTW